MNNTLELIIGFAIQLVGFYLVWRKLTHEKVGIDMAAIASAATALADYSAEVVKLRAELTQQAERYTRELAALRKSVQVAEDRVERQEKEIRSWKDWTRRLYYQLKSQGTQPVAPPPGLSPTQLNGKEV